MSLALTGPVTGSRLVSEQPALPATFADLPLGARVFFALVMAAGAGALLLQTSAGYSHWPVFLALLAGASVAALFRVDLPFSPQGATMSLSFAFAFAGLLLLGPHPTLIIAAVAAWVQCTVNVSPRTPLHRTAFSMAAVAVTAKASGLVFLGLGGDVAFAVPGLIGQEKAILGAALTYFVLNTLDHGGGGLAHQRRAAGQGVERTRRLERAELHRRRRRCGDGRGVAVGRRRLAHAAAGRVRST